ncbi:cytochrome P450 [Mycena vitilis]|nr:cytochrome P450 [Mycena vitilis]
MWFRPKQHVPALLGSYGPFPYYFAVSKFFLHASDIIGKGCKENPDGVFRVPRLLRWDYIANGPKRTAEMAAAPDDVLSFQHGAEDILQADFAMGPEITTNPWHQHTVRSSLTRNIGRCLPQLHDELVCAFDELLVLQVSDWKEITVLAEMMPIVARSTARVFVGLPLCRNKKYIDLSISYTVSVFGHAQIIAMFPKKIEAVTIIGIFGRLLSPKRSCMRIAMKTLGPVIKERLAKDAELGQEWHDDKPNDYMQWLLDDAEPSERNPNAIALRLLATDTAAIHTSSMAITTALFDLTTHPEHIEPMREEAERGIGAEGWTKSALNNLHKIDSFLRESQRMTRKVISDKGFTFSDGTFIPQGSFLINYENPDVFDGFRFSRERTVHGDEGGVFRHHMVSTGTDHLVFGHGKHAGPGRFFAAAELKTILAHILMNYDVKIEGVRPANFAFGILIGPNPKGTILIRKRQAA